METPAVQLNAFNKVKYIHVNPTDGLLGEE